MITPDGRGDQNKASIMAGSNNKFPTIYERYCPQSRPGHWVLSHHQRYFADTRSHYVLTVNDATGETGQAILALSASQVKASKMLMTSLQQKKVDTARGKQTPPTFANRVRLTTVGMSNEKGSWSGVRFDLDGLVTDAAIFAEAKAFYKAIAAGEVKVDFAKADQQSAGVSDEPKNADDF